MDEETLNAGPISSSATAESDVDELPCLSGDKPFFDVILVKSNVGSPYHLTVPARIVHEFPSGDVPVVLTHGGKKWSVLYHGKTKKHYFENSGWRKFIADNNLEIGDACIFEIMESSRKLVRLRVVILRNTIELPPELRVAGETLETAIELD